MLNLSASILIVDDMASVCELVAGILNGLGYKNVVQANNVEAAKEMLLTTLGTANEIKLVLSDINMPKEDGLTFLKWIRSNHLLAKVPVIMISAMGDIVNVMDAAESGASFFILKPVTEESLKSKLARI